MHDSDLPTNLMSSLPIIFKRIVHNVRAAPDHLHTYDPYSHYCSLGRAAGRAGRHLRTTTAPRGQRDIAERAQGHCVAVRHSAATTAALLPMRGGVVIVFFPTARDQNQC